MTTKPFISQFRADREIKTHVNESFYTDDVGVVLDEIDETRTTIEDTAEDHRQYHVDISITSVEIPEEE